MTSDQYELALKRAAREISQIEKDHAIRYQYMAAASHQRSVEFMADGDLDKAAIFQLHRAHFAKRARWWMRIEP